MPSDRPGMTALALSRTRALRDMAILLATFLAFWKEEVLSLILLRSVISPTASSSLHITLLGSPSGKKQTNKKTPSASFDVQVHTKCGLCMYMYVVVYTCMHIRTMYAHILCSLATLQCLVDRTSICTMFMPYQMYVHYNLRVQHWNLTYTMYMHYCRYIHCVPTYMYIHTYVLTYMYRRSQQKKCPYYFISTQ